VTYDFLEIELVARCRYLRRWRMGQKFKLHILKFCQCPAPTRRAVTQSARRRRCDKKYKKPHLVQAVRRVRVKNVQVLFGAWTYFSGVTGYASHSVTCGVGAGDQSTIPHDPLPGSPSRVANRNFYRSAGFEPRTEVRQIQAFNHLNTSD
jgi:hypothetical protein